MSIRSKPRSSGPPKFACFPISTSLAASRQVEMSMRFQAFSFGSIRINGVTYPHDVVIDRGQLRKRKKKPWKQFCDAFKAHTAVGGGGYSLEMPADDALRYDFLGW